MIETNSIKAWFLAARPETLSAAAVPVLLGIALAYKDLSATANGSSPALSALCMGNADRLQSGKRLFRLQAWQRRRNPIGAERACAEGWITMKAMKWGIILTTLLGCIIGLPLVFYGG